MFHVEQSKTKQFKIMDIALAKEIYGQPWFMDAHSFQLLSGSLQAMQNGNFSASGNKLNAAEMLLVGENKYICVVSLDGPITKSGGLSHYGTKEIAATLLQADTDETVVGHILRINSGGGSAKAVRYMRDALQQIKKPKIAFGEDYNASAAYYISLFCDMIIMSDKNDYVGSIGTMIEMSGYPKEAENKTDGWRTVRVYADASALKNGDFESAINDFNIEPIKENILNPLNDEFIADVKQRRPNATADELSGKTVFAGDAVGTLIDKIGTFQDAVNAVFTIFNNSNNFVMNKAEFAAKYPELYQEVLAEGVKTERDRVQALTVYADVNLGKVKEMISSGEMPTQSFFAEMTRESLKNDLLQKVEAEAPETVQLDSAELEKTEQKANFDNLLAEVKKFANS